MRRFLPAFAGTAVLAGLAAFPEAPSARVPALTAAWEEGDCGLCHTVPDHPPATRLESCTDCHVWIRDVAADPAKRAKAAEIFPLWPRYEKNVRSYVEVPSLDAALDRLDPEWVRAYLADPHDLRPNLDEAMPRFALSDASLDAIAAEGRSRQPTVASTPAPTPQSAARGEVLFTDRGCAACHTFGAHHAETGIPMAPDLAHTRDRMDLDVAAAWIANPKAISEHATMPSLGLPADEAIALRDYLWLTDPAWSLSERAFAEIAPITEPVVWADVESRVFGKICAHCHMNPEANEGRAGPGNAGGFGYPATGVELETYEGVVAVLDAIPDALLRRRAEADRDWVAPGQKPKVLTRPGQPGMPLGHPPIPDEDISLVLGWIDQGAPR